MLPAVEHMASVYSAVQEPRAVQKQTRIFHAHASLLFVYNDKVGRSHRTRTHSIFCQPRTCSRQHRRHASANLGGHGLVISGQSIIGFAGGALLLGIAGGAPAPRSAAHGPWPRLWSVPFCCPTRSPSQNT